MQPNKSLTARFLRHERRPLIMLFLAALLARLAFLWLSGAYDQIINDDGAAYARLALSLLAGDGFAWGPGQPTAHRPFGYPWLIAAIVGLCGPSMAAVQWVQALLGSLVVLPTYALGRRLGGPRGPARWPGWRSHGGDMIDCWSRCCLSPSQPGWPRP